MIFSLDVTNPSNEEIDVSFMMNLPFGYNDDTIRRGNNFAEIAFTRLVTAADCQNACAKKSKCMAWTTNGPFSCMLKDGMPLHAYEYGIISGLKGEWSVKQKGLNCKRPGFYAQSGDITLRPVDSGSEVTSFTVEDDPEVVWDVFKKTGKRNVPLDYLKFHKCFVFLQFSVSVMRHLSINYLTKTLSFSAYNWPVG